MKTILVGFVADMVLAINEDRKTHTRSGVSAPMTQSANSVRHYYHDWFYFLFSESCGETRLSVRCPFGQPGDRIGVRERARVLGYPAPDKALIRYEADKVEAVVPWPSRLRPVAIGKCIPNGCHREAVRTWLEITGVRVERLNEISEGDAKAEGIEGHSGEYWCPNGGPHHTAAGAFRELFESVYGPGSFDSRWVWVVEFTRIPGPQAGGVA